MSTVGNIAWIILGGLIVALLYFIAGLLLCLTIIGIPFGVQLFKIGNYALWPFGRNVVASASDTGCLSLAMNILWILFAGIEIALIHIGLGIVFCITIIGIPFGIKHFRLALLATLPFGKDIIPD
ncbi:MAG: YccF domain-containing protein [Candidatus Cryptobacteroides sp.]